jgi:hypothetical protein
MVVRYGCKAKSISGKNTSLSKVLAILIQDQRRHEGGQDRWRLSRVGKDLPEFLHDGLG